MSKVTISFCTGNAAFETDVSEAATKHEVLQTSWTTPYGPRSMDHATATEALDHRRDLVSWGYVLTTSFGGYHHYTKGGR